MDKKIERVNSGINGFDNLCQGGFVKNSINLVSGTTGAGKTTFVTQFLYNGITQYNEPGVYISFEEDLSSLKEDALAYGWDFDTLEKQGKCSFIYVHPYEKDFSLFKQRTLLEETIEKEIKRIKAKRIVIDPITLFSMALKDPYEIRKQIYSLTKMLKKSGCTVLITSEVLGQSSLEMEEGTSSMDLSRYGVEEFVAESVTTLHSSGLGGEADRAVRIVKMRRTNHIKGPIPMKITDNGIVVMSKKSSYK